MSTATAPAGPIARGPAQIARVPFTRLVRTELRKTYDTRAGMWLLIALALLTIAGNVLFMIFTDDRSELNMLNFVGFGSFLQALLLPVLGVLVVTSEWSQRTGLVTFTLEPSRGRSLSAKVGAVVLLGLAAVAVLLVFAALLTVLSGAVWSEAGAWNFGVEYWAQLLTQQMFYLLSGLAIGMILLNSAAAIVLSFMIPLVFSILVGVIPWLEDKGPWIDKNVAMQDFLVSGAVVNGTDWAHVAVTSLWWVWIPLLAGIYRVMRSEVK